MENLKKKKRNLISASSHSQRFDKFPFVIYFFIFPDKQRGEPLAADPARGPQGDDRVGQMSPGGDQSPYERGRRHGYSGNYYGTRCVYVIFIWTVLEDMVYMSCNSMEKYERYREKNVETKRKVVEAKRMSTFKWGQDFDRSYEEN